MDREAFEEVVAEALDDLPGEFRRRLRNVQVVVEDWPSPAQLRAARIRPGQTLFGLYHGVPLTQRMGQPPLMPDQIFLFRGPLTRVFREPETLRAQIRHTVIHEIAHFFGISDDRLRELGAY